MEYNVVRSKRRSISIHVGPDGVTVKAPHRVKDDFIEDFVNSNMGWVVKQTSKYDSHRKKSHEMGMYVTAVPYMGSMKELELKDARVMERMSMSGDKFVATVKDVGNVRKLYTKWLRKNAPKIFSDRVEKYKGVVGVEPSTISVRNQRTRWGSASGKGALSFNLNLIKAPMSVIDYVVVHELSHLRVRDHSKKFWKLVESVMPDYNESRKWLRKNRLVLME